MLTWMQPGMLYALATASVQKMSSSMVSPLVQYRLLTWLPGKLTQTAFKIHILNKLQLPRYEVGAVILHSPLMSGMRVAFPKTQRTWCFDAFPSIDKVSKVTSPVLVIHGTEDEVIDFSHGIAIHDKCPKAVEPLWVEVNKQTIKSTAF
jgi:pimeloyl-ACP methyl ester carboxylesterase